MYFSKSRVGFIPKEWKEDGTYTADNWPHDAIEATAEEIATYWRVQPPKGKMLGSIKGRPAWVDLPAQPPKTREAVEQDRLAAYANPITGSDRFFAEAVRLQAMGAPSDEVDAAKAAGAARYFEIQGQNPWP